MSSTSAATQSHGARHLGMAGSGGEAASAMRYPIEVWTLDNGLRVLLQPDPSTPLVAVYTSYSAGSARDPEDRSGLAHLCEHLSFAGRQGDPSMDATAGHLSQVIEEVGGVTDARTSHDRTVFGCLVPDHHLDLALWTESRRMAAPACGLSPQALHREQLIIGREQRQMLDDPPYGRAMGLLHEMLYPPGHAYRLLPIGSAEGVRRVTVADVAAFFKDHYRPEHAVLTVVGRLSVRRARALIERYFARLGSPGEAVERRPQGLDPAVLAAATDAGATAPVVTDPVVTDPLGTEPIANRRRTRWPGVPFARTYVAWQAPSYGSGEHRLPGLLAKCWAGRDCPLQRRLVGDLKVAQIIEATLIDLRWASTLVFHATAQRGVEATRLEQALLEALEAEIEGGVDGQTLHKAQRKAVTDHYVAMRYLPKRADFLAQHLSYLGDAGVLETEDERLASPGVEELQGFLGRVCRSDRRTVLTLMPQ